jgi:hypothetical protein
VISAIQERWPGVVAIAAGLLLGGLCAFVLVRDSTPSGVDGHSTWSLYFGALLALAAVASVAGALVRSPAVGGQLLAITAGTLGGLTFVLIFSIGFLLLPFAIGMGFAAGARSKGAAVSPQSLVLAGSLPVLALFLGLFTLYH